MLITQKVKTIASRDRQIVQHDSFSRDRRYPFSRHRDCRIDSHFDGCNIRQARENRRPRYTAQRRLSFTRNLAAPRLIFTARVAGGDRGYSKSLRLVINGSWHPSSAGGPARPDIIN